MCRQKSHFQTVDPYFERVQLKVCLVSGCPSTGCWIQGASQSAAGGTALPLDRPEGAATQQLQLVTEARGHGVPPAAHTCEGGARRVVRRSREGISRQCKAVKIYWHCVFLNFNQLCWIK